ncbi:MAG TPA: four helix bundle protein [Terriglobales bacterium]
MVTFKAFPGDEMFGLTSQMRGAFASIGMKIAEGCRGKGDAELGRFLEIAMASASELEYQFLLAREPEYLPGPAYERLIAPVIEVKKMLSSLMQKVKGFDGRLRADS